jgi:hypothetical protein
MNAMDAKDAYCTNSYFCAVCLELSESEQIILYVGPMSVPPCPNERGIMQTDNDVIRGIFFSS